LLHLLLIHIIGLRQCGRRWGRGNAGSRCIFGRPQLVLLQAVQGRNLIGQRAQRCHLHIAVMRNLRHLFVVFAKVFAVLTHLVEALCLHQHPGV